MAEVDIQAVVLAATTAALGNALQIALVEIAKQHGGMDGPWLDRLRSQFVDEIKRSTSEGLTYEQEVLVMDTAIAVVNGFIDGAQVVLPPRQDEGD